MITRLSRWAAFGSLIIGSHGFCTGSNTMNSARPVGRLGCSAGALARKPLRKSPSCLLPLAAAPTNDELKNGSLEETNDAAWARRRAQAVAEQWPFIEEADLYAAAVQLNSPGLRLPSDSSARACATSGAQQARALPSLLQDFSVSKKTMLPLDARRRVRARCTLSFAAPLPLQVLPAQRARVQQANLTLRADGKVCIIIF